MFTVVKEVIVIGTLDCEGSDVSFGAMRLENGGEYIATTATTIITGDVDVSGTKYAWWVAYASGANGVFTHSGGTVKFTDSTATTNPALQSGGDKFNTVVVEYNTRSLTNHHEFVLDGTYTLEEGLHSDGSNGFDIDGDVVVETGGDLRLSQSTGQTKYITVDNGGRFKAPSGYLKIESTDNGETAFDIIDGAEFWHHNGTVQFVGGNSEIKISLGSGHASPLYTDTNSFYNVTFDGVGNGNGWKLQRDTIVENDTKLYRGMLYSTGSVVHNFYGTFYNGDGNGGTSSYLRLYTESITWNFHGLFIHDNGGAIQSHPSNAHDTLYVNFLGGMHILHQGNGIQRGDNWTFSSIINDAASQPFSLPGTNSQVNNPFKITGTGGVLDGDFDTASSYQEALAFDIDTDAALEFSGADHVEMGDAVGRTWSNGITSSAWIYRTGSDEDFVNVLDSSAGFSWSIFTDGRVWVYHGDLSSTSLQTPTNPSTLRIPSDSWQHVAVSYDPDADSITIYLNGQIFYCWAPSGCGGTATITGTVVNSPTGHNHIGKWSNTSYNWEGMIADSRLYDEALDISEIQLMSSRVNRETPTTPFAWWKLNDKVSTIDNHGSCDGTPSDCDGTANWGGGNWVYPYTVDIPPGTVFEDNVTVTSGTLSGLASSQINFDGFNDILHTSSDFTMSHDNSTISIWVKKDNATGNEDTVMGEADDANQHWLKIDTNGDIEFRDYNPSGRIRCDTAITDTEWHHLVITMNGDSNGAIYVDGVAQTLTDNDITNDLTFDSFGARGSTTDPFDGKMREIKVYEVGLSADQVKSLYLNTLLSTPQHHWKLDEGSWTGSYDRLDTGYATAAPLNASGATMQNIDIHIGNLWLTSVGGTYSAARGETIIDGMPATAGTIHQYSWKHTLGTFIHNNGTVHIAFTGWDGVNVEVPDPNTAGRGGIYDLKATLPTGSYATARINWRTYDTTTFNIENNFTLIEGRFRPSYDHYDLTVGGLMTVESGGVLGYPDSPNYTGTWSFNCMEIENGGIYYATSATTKITGSNCSTTNGGNYWKVDSGGEFYHNYGTVELDTTQGSQWIDSRYSAYPFWNFTLTEAGGASARCSGGASGIHIENILRIDLNTLDCGNVLLNAGTIINNSTIDLGNSCGTLTDCEVYVNSFINNSNVNANSNTVIHFIGTGGVMQGDFEDANVVVETDSALEIKASCTNPNYLNSRVCTDNGETWSGTSARVLDDSVIRLAGSCSAGGHLSKSACETAGETWTGSDKTLSIWYKTPGPEEFRQLTQDTGGNLSSNLMAKYYYTYALKIRWFSNGGEILCDDSSPAYRYSTGRPIDKPDTWYHIACTGDWDAVANGQNNMQVFVNGINVSDSSTAANADGGSDGSTGALYFGSHAGNPPDTVGTIADAKIYNKELTDADILKLASYINYPNSKLADSGFLKGSWAFNEGAFNTCSGGGDVCDLSGNNNELKFVSPPSDDYANWVYPYSLKLMHDVNVDGDFTITKGTVDSSGLSSVTFTGDQYIDMGDNTELEPNAFTLSAWFNPGSVGSGYQFIAGKSHLAGPSHDEYGFHIQNGIGHFTVNNAGDTDNCGGSSCVLAGDGAFTAGTWYHLIGVRDSNDDIRFYIDGVETADSISKAYNVETKIESSHCFGVGQRNTGCSYTTSDALKDNGKVSDLKYYDYGLTAEQVEGLYLGYYPVTPLHWWKLGGNEYDRNGIVSDSGTATFLDPDWYRSYNGVSGTSVGTQWGGGYCDSLVVHQDVENTITCSETTTGGGWAGFGDGGYTGNTTSIWDQQGHDRIYENEVYVAEFDLVVHPGTAGGGPFKFGLQTSPVGSGCTNMINLSQSPATSGRIIHTYVGNGNATCESTGGMFSNEMGNDGSGTQSYSISNFRMTKYTGIVGQVGTNPITYEHGVFGVADLTISSDTTLTAPHGLLTYDGDFNNSGTFEHNEGIVWNIKSGGKMQNTGTVEPVFYRVGCTANFEIKKSITVEKEMNCYSIDIRDSSAQVLITLGTLSSQGKGRTSLAGNPVVVDSQWQIEYNTTYKHGVVGASEQFPALLVGTRKDNNAPIKNNTGSGYATFGNIVMEGTYGVLGTAATTELTGDFWADHLYVADGATFNCNNNNIYVTTLTIIGTLNSGGTCTITNVGAQGSLLGDIADTPYAVDLDGVFNFDGNDDYLETPDANNLDLTTDFTIGAWINPSSSGSGWQMIVSKNHSSESGDTNRPYALWFLGSSNRIYLYTSDGSGGATSCNTA